MKAFEVYCGDVISGLKVHWAKIGRPYVLVGHPSAKEGCRVLLSNELIESIGFEGVDRIAECDLSFDNMHRCVLVPPTMPAQKSVLALVTDHDSGFPNYNHKMAGTGGSSIARSANFEWHIGDGLHERGLSSLVKLSEGDSLEIAQLRRFASYDGPLWKHLLGLSKETYKITRERVGSLTVGGSGQLVYTKVVSKYAGDIE